MKSFASTSSEIDVSKSQSPHYVKFALLCLHKRNLPILCGYLCFVLSQLQLMALFLKNTYAGFSDNTPSSSAAIKLFIRFFVIGDWVDHADTTPILVGIIISTVYILMLLCVFTYLNLSLYYRKTVPEGTQRLLAALHNYHPLVFFFWVHTFCLEIIRFSYKEEDFRTSKDFAITVLACVNLFFNWVFGIFFSMIYVTYKTKNPLASKTNALEIHIFLLKSVISILWVFTENQEGLQMFIFTLSLVSVGFHDWIFYKYLPYYHIKLLELNLFFKGPQTALVLGSFIIKAVAMSGTRVGLYEIQVIWLMLSPLLIKAYHRFLWKLLRWVFTCEPSDESNIYYLVHKRVILLYFYEERKIIHEGMNDLALLDLLYQGKLSHFVAQMKLSFSDLDRNKKVLFNTLRLFYHRIIKQRPKSLLAKVDLAYFYSKLENLYLISNNLIEEIALQHPGYQAQISLSFIRFLLQRKLSLQFSEKTMATTTSKGLNIDNYISNQDLKKKFKNAVEKQVQLQISFWKDFLVNKPDMLQLMKGASEVDKQKKIIKKLWANLLRQRPYTFLSPLIVYGMYASLVNNDSGEGEKYIEQYHEDSKRFKKIMKIDELNNATAFCDKTIRLTMSGLKKNLGKILDSSSNITQSFGWNPEEIKDKSVAILMTPFYNKIHEGFFSTYFNSGKMKILNNTICVPVKRADGYIQQAWMHVKVSPWVELGISYITLIRPSRSTARILLITKHGHIDGMSKDFAEEMNIKRFDKQKTQLSIFNFCPEFRPVNDAFNIAAENFVLNNSIPTAVSEVVSVSRSGVAPPKVDRDSSFDVSYTQTSAIMDRSSLVQGDTSRMTERPLINNPKSGETADKRSFSRGRSFYDSAGTGTGAGKNLNSGSASQEFKFDDNSQVENNGGVQGIFDRFSKGGKLVFYPRDSLSGNKTILTYKGPDFRSKAVAYTVQVINKVYGKDMIKVVLLEKNTELNDETGADLNSSDPENTLPSSNQVTIEYADDRKKKKLKTNDELVSPNFNPTSGSPPKWKAREAGSLYMSSPVKPVPRSSFARNVNSKQAAQQQSEQSESEISSELSISDEVESEDNSIKKVITRSVVRGKKGNHPDQSVGQLTNDPNSMSFCPNIDREIGRESLSPKGLEAFTTWSPNVETRRASVNFAQHQFLKIFEERRGSSPKVQSAEFSSPNKKSRSTIFYHEEDARQGVITDGFLKGKLQRIKARIHEAVLQHLQKAENSVTSSYLSREKKVQHMVTQALKLEPKKKSSLLYSGSFITFILSMIVCLAIQTVNLGKGILTVQDQTPVITGSFFRQNALVYTSYLITIWKGAIEGTFSTGDWIADTQAWRIYLAPALKLLEQYDQELWGLVGDMPLDIQDRFFEKNIPIYESLESQNLLSVDSFFEAVQKIIDRETRIVNMQIPFVYTANIDTSNFVFVLDNALNNILISSESLIEFLREKLKSSIDNTISNMTITLCCVLALALAFFLTTVRYLFFIYYDAERFMTLIFRISPSDGEAAQDILQRFKDALVNNMRTLELPKEEKNKNENDETTTQTSSVKYRYASMTSFGRSQRLRFLQLLPNYFTFICWSVVYYFITSEFIQNIQVSEVQMLTALKGLFHQQLMTYEFIALTLNNGSSFLRNEEFLPDFVNNLNNIQDTQGLVSNFREQDGSLTALTESVLFDFPCSGFKDYNFGELEYVYAACISLGNEDMRTDLMSVNSAIYNSGTQYLQSFYESLKTSSDLAMMFLTGITGFQNLVMTAQGLLTILYESTHDSFEERVDRIKEQTIIFSLVMLFIAMIITFVTWSLVLRKIFRSQNIDQKILQIIPVRLILNNKHIQQYVLRFSSGDSLNGMLRFY